MDEYKSMLLELLIRAGIETCMLLVIIWFLFWRTQLLKKIQPLGSERMICFGLFFLIWICIQLTDRWQYFYPQKFSLYPLTRFAMYQHGTADEVVESYKFQIEFADNTTQTANLTQVFSAIGLPSISTRMRVLANDLERAEERPERYVRAVQEINSYMDAYRKWQMGEHPHLPSPKRIQFIRTKMSIDGFFEGKENVSESLLLEWKSS